MKTIKKIVTLCLTSLAAIGSCVALSDSIILPVVSENCQHVGNHYTKRDATEDIPGCLEYWVCCNCNEHYLYEPTGSWDDRGTATEVVNSTDDRYIKLTTYTEALVAAVIEAGFGNYTINDDGSVAVNYYTADKKDPNSKYVIIPEGVTSLNGDTFKGYNKDNCIEYIIVPSTVTSISGDANGNLGLGQLKDSLVWYFVGNYIYNKEIKKYCEILNTGWHYDTSNQPVADHLITAK